MLEPPAPVLASDLFKPDRTALLELLRELTAEEWERPTVCQGWTVKDVVLHLLGGDLGNLSRRRDGFQGMGPAPGESLVAYINRLNTEWVGATRRLSPQVVRELLAWVGPPLFEYFASLDPMAMGAPVSWAGDEPAPVWLDVAREYTERWHHQQHIRDAVGRPGQLNRRFLYPVLATFAHALPVALGGTEAPHGTMVHFHVEGEAGGDWAVVREGGRWRLYMGAPPIPDTRITLDQALAWRFFTKGVTPQEAERQSTIEGERQLGARLLHAVAIIA
ncbi:MAG: maleylpyruvate isomerase family mycothiol-dependent enzyme [Chloroflexota bacterium]|nr:maleylpyruvate isomerase family mycothiol-dependent enzyme [Chloroflexota bacterium]